MSLVASSQTLYLMMNNPAALGLGNQSIPHTQRGAMADSTRGHPLHILLTHEELLAAYGCLEAQGSSWPGRELHAAE